MIHSVMLFTCLVSDLKYIVMCICLWTEQIFFEGWLEKIVNEEFVSKNSVRHSQQLCLVKQHYALVFKLQILLTSHFIPRLNRLWKKFNVHYFKGKLEIMPYHSYLINSNICLRKESNVLWSSFFCSIFLRKRYKMRCENLFLSQNNLCATLKICRHENFDLCSK